MDDNKNEEIVRKKIDTFYKNKNKVCIHLFKGFYKHGYINEISSDFFMFVDRFEGEIPVFFIELKDVMLSSVKD